jgi:hypothetical protein
MTGTFKPHLTAPLLILAAALFGAPAQAAPSLNASASEVSVGETIQIDAASGSSMIPVYAKDWNVSPEFSLVSASRTGAKIRALTPGYGSVSANVNLKELSIDIKVNAAKATVAAPVTPAPAANVAPAAPAPEVVAAPPAAKNTACQQEMVERKREIAQDFNQANYDAARAKLLDMKKTWLEDSRWADALLGAINTLSPPQPAAQPAAR